MRSGGNRRHRLGHRLASFARTGLTALALALAIPAAGHATTAGMATLSADQVTIDAQGRLVATGAVEVWHGSVRMTASRVVYDPRSGRLNVEGPITLSDGPNRLFLADSADLSADLRDGLVQSARMVLDQQMQFAAASIAREDDRLTHMNAVVASSCPVCAANPTPLWEIRATRVTHDEQARQLHFRGAQFRVMGLPVFYAPYMRLPDPGLTRARGFLVPRWSVDSRLGFSVSLPYFIPFGPSRDLTVTPTVASRDSQSLALRYRAAMARAGLDLGGQISRDRLTPDRLRGYAYLRALTALGNDFWLDADILIPGDREYLDTYGITDSRRIRSDLSIWRMRRNELVRARLTNFRSLEIGADNAVLPANLAQADWERRLGPAPQTLGGDLTLRMGARAVQRPSGIDGDAGRDVARVNLMAEWRRRAVLPAGVVATGALQGRVDHVRIGDDGRWPDPVTRASGAGMLELRWPWAASNGRGGGHVIEPVVQVIGARRNRAALPNDDHVMPELDPGNLFAFNRYAGYDAPDDGSRINAGLQWTWLGANGWTAEALAGRIWRRGPYDGFDPANPQPLGQQRSDWLLAGRLGFGDSGSWSLRLLFDDNRGLRRGETSVDWRRSDAAVSATYVYLPANPFEGRNENRAELYLDASREFENGWSGRMGWEIDMLLREARTARAGMVFRGDCVAVDLSLSHRFATSTNVSSTSLGLRVDLLGIGGARATPTGRSCRS